METVVQERPRSGDGRGGDLAERGAEALWSLREGNTGALGAFVTDVTPLLWHSARSQGVGASDAQDVVQGVWVRFVAHADRIEDPRAVLQWLLVSTRRAAWSAVRSARRTELQADVGGEEPGSAGVSRAPAATDDPEHVVLRDERDRLLWDAVERLDERCRTLLRLVALVDRPNYSAVSAALGMPVGSIGPTRGRCLAKLRTELESHGGWAR